MRCLQNIFSEQSVQQIVSSQTVPTQDETVSDSLIWRKSSSGTFSMKIAYQLQMEVGTVQVGNSSGGWDWEKFWRVSGVLLRVKVFVWRAMHQALPTMKVLHRRIKNISPICPRCGGGGEDETIPHLLFFCPVARISWFVSPLAIKTDELPLQMEAILEHLMNTIPIQLLPMCFYCMWEIWKSRNRLIFRGEKEDPHSIRCQVLALMKNNEEVQRRNCAVTRGAGFLPRGEACYGFGDGSWDTVGRAGIGVALYSTNGSLQHVCCKAVNAQSSLHAEIIGVMHMIEIIEEMKINPPIYMCTDAQSLVLYCNSGDEAYITDWRNITPAQQLREKLVQMNGTVLIVHVPRTSNGTAHLLANWARSNGTFFRGYPPP